VREGDRVEARIAPAELGQEVSDRQVQARQSSLFQRQAHQRGQHHLGDGKDVYRFVAPLVVEIALVDHLTAAQHDQRARATLGKPAPGGRLAGRRRLPPASATSAAAPPLAVVPVRWRAQSPGA